MNDVGLVRSEHNVADGLTKAKPCQALEDVIVSGRDVNPVAQWIRRTTSPLFGIAGECESTDVI